jgi:putative nucleotidyltransferase with HDIG domain
MTTPYDAQPIQKQLDEMEKMLARIVKHLASVNRGKTDLILRDLTHVANSLANVRKGVSGHLDSYQRQIGALVGIGSAINSSLDLRRVLEGVMDSLINLVGAERGFLMLTEPNGELHIRVARGIDRDSLEHEPFSTSRTIVLRVIESGEAIVTTNAQDDPRFLDQKSVAAFRLLSILCVPLKIKNKLIGVIYVDHRAHKGLFGHEELDLISAFANLAAVAIHNAGLFEDLQESKAELELAYQATLEGWVRALDMRDRETEGHTMRVTTLTQRLAKEMGFSGDDLTHITRGALLHDIGKMAIPDGILLKPAPLSPEERLMMQKHPVYAYEMLSSIKFLRPTIDIPYCHHEKWDGTGYPRGLKGEEIPLAARIFAVVDVWDALVSDRPYRKGLMPATVRNSIQELSGTHFDPHIVDVFLSLKRLHLSVPLPAHSVP